MTPSTVFDRRTGSLALGCATLASGLYGLIQGFTVADGNALLMLMGSLVPFLLGLLCTMVVATSANLDKLNMTWTGMSNLFAGILAGYWTYVLGLSALFAAAPAAGGIISGLAAAFMVWTMIRFP